MSQFSVSLFCSRIGITNRDKTYGRSYRTKYINKLRTRTSKTMSQLSVSFFCSLASTLPLHSSVTPLDCRFLQQLSLGLLFVHFQKGQTIWKRLQTNERMPVWPRFGLWICLLWQLGKYSVTSAAQQCMRIQHGTLQRIAHCLGSSRDFPLH